MAIWMGADHATIIYITYPTDRCKCTQFGLAIVWLSSEKNYKQEYSCKHDGTDSIIYDEREIKNYSKIADES